MCNFYSLWLLWFIHALHASIPVERNPRPPSGSLAQSLPVVANRNLLRGKDATDRSPGILGVHLAGAQESVALFEMDGGNGTLRPPQAEEFVTLLPVAGRCGAFQDDVHFAALAASNNLRGRSAIGGNF